MLDEEMNGPNEYLDDLATLCLRRDVNNIIQGTPYDPAEGSLFGNPQLMTEQALATFCADVIADILDAFHDLPREDWENSPMQSVVCDLNELMFRHQEIDAERVGPYIRQFADRPPQEGEEPTHVSHKAHPEVAWIVGEAPCLECCDDTRAEKGEIEYTASLIRECEYDGGWLTVACGACSWAGVQELYDELDPLSPSKEVSE